ncbi:hypothetical protein NLJ89_g10223 [Agrocybe chaxingu]|uniref:Uncharacterized protein n=1 Tax=Agrocybe chaxingu TaxID=84603 RepID=A0A9W8MSU5_9AGAR|nr:hypothetical protein NLJ89_g10223 [Agrocybe chaxingu]
MEDSSADISDSELLKPLPKSVFDKLDEPDAEDMSPSTSASTAGKPKEDLSEEKGALESSEDEDEPRVYPESIPLTHLTIRSSVCRLE